MITKLVLSPTYYSVIYREPSDLNSHTHRNTKDSATCAGKYYPKKKPKKNPIISKINSKYLTKSTHKTTKPQVNKIVVNNCTLSSPNITRSRFHPSVSQCSFFCNLGEGDYIVRGHRRSWKFATTNALPICCQSGIIRS